MSSAFYRNTKDGPIPQNLFLEVYSYPSTQIFAVLSGKNRELLSKVYKNINI